MKSAFFHEEHALHRRHRALNNLHTTLLVAGSLALLAFTAWAIAGTTGIIYALMFGGFSMFAARRVSPAMVLRMYKAKHVDANTFPSGYRLIHELSRRANLPVPPKLYIVPSKMMNAFAVGRRDESAIAVTDALVRTLTTRELAGVLAHEITHIRNEDIKVMSLADMVSRLTTTLSTLGIIALLFNLGGFFPNVPLLGIIAMIASPTVGSLLQLALSRTREFDADYGAALLTGDPDGLSSALGKLEQAFRRRLEGVVLPASRMPEPSMLRSHPPTAERVARLTALKETLLAPPLPIEKKTTGPTRRARSVPVIAPNFSKRAADDFHSQWIALAATQAPSPAIHNDEEGACAACDTSLNAPDDKGRAPRIRPARGGVWW